MSHAREANVPVVVAINKCNKSGADSKHVKTQLGSEGQAMKDLGD
jgi:translation initiation factor IF-2